MSHGRQRWILLVIRTLLVSGLR